MQQAELCSIRQPLPRRGAERGVRAVVLLTAVMMVVEIAVGQATHSMALLADGWHMATHVGALGLAAIAYEISRRFATHRAFAFGTGKVHALAGYTSAVILGLVAVGMIVESATRLAHPREIDFASSLPVAIVGLLVNLLSVRLLHGHHDGHEGHSHHDHDHGHEHAHDHNHRAALVHVVADTLTSALAIGALLLGRYLGWTWLDPVSGIVGGVVIVKWGWDLSRNASFELLDVDPSATLEEKVRQALEADEGVRVTDVHVWSVGQGRRCGMVTLIASQPHEVGSYRSRLLQLGIAHVTIEIQRADIEERAIPSERHPLVGHDGGLDMRTS